MTHLNKQRFQAFKRAIKQNDKRTAEEILNSAIAANYPRILTDSMQASLKELANKHPRQSHEKYGGPQHTYTAFALKVAIVVHCFYLDIWPEISQRLMAIEAAFDTFITTTNDRLEEVAKVVTKDFPGARIYGAPNRGMDILPFLSIIPILHNEGYEVACKIQTKKGDGKLAIVWRDLMLDTLIGSTNNFSVAVQEFQNDKKLVIAGPGALYQSAQKLMLDNQPAINHITEKTWGEDIIHNDDWGFFAGTMFWTRIEPLIPLSKHFNSSTKEVDSAYKQDGKTEHGLERVFGLLSVVEGGHAGLMYPTAKGLGEQTIIRYADNEGAGMAHIGTVMRAIDRFNNDKKLIQDSGLFDASEYLRYCPELNGVDIDLVFHYLTTGTFKNYWPCVKIRPSNTLKKEAMESTTYSDMLTYMCQQLRDGRPLESLSAKQADTSSFGLREISIISSSELFDKQFYFQQRPDLARLNANPIEHYVYQGVYDECYPNRHFVPREYLALNRDVLEANIEPFTHYLTHGCLENRRYRETLRREVEDSPFFRYQAINEILIDWNDIQGKDYQPNLISIIIPIFNNHELTFECLQSIATSKSNINYELICVDNGSNDETKKALLDWKEQFNIAIIENEENYNFALGCNIGFSNANGETAVFLNNDTTVTDYWLDELVKPLHDSTIKAVQPRLLYPDLTVQCIGVVFAANQVIGYPIYAGIDSAEPAAKQSRRLKAITAACMAVRATDFAKMKGFDPLFINGQEDIDFCLRLCQSFPEASCYCQATSNVIHYESKTPGRGSYIKLNRINFANRWRGSIASDDFKYYADDKYDIVGWCRDNQAFLDLDIGASRPNLRKSKVSRVKYSWDMLTEDEFIRHTMQYYSLLSGNIDDLLVSIIMPTRNRADIISRAIESVLFQTHQNFELLIIDDGSTDGTKDVVNVFLKDSRVNFIPITKSGVSKARNQGLDLANGKLISYLDSDNSWEPNFLRLMVCFLEEHGLDAGYSGIRALDDSYVTVRYRGDIFDWDECLAENFIDINAFIHRAASIRNDTDLQRFVDWDFILRLTADKSVGYAPFVGVCYYDGTEYQRITNTISVDRGATETLQEYVRGKHALAAVNQKSPLLSISNHPSIARISGYQLHINVPCPSISEAQAWGDYHLACSLGKALNDLAFSSEIHTLDSWYETKPGNRIILVIRGLSMYKPDPSDFNLLWIISHPDKISAEELEGYDHIFVASHYYSEILKRITKKPISVLLQATDAQRFNPDIHSPIVNNYLFVGNSRKIYRPIVKYLIESGFDLAVYGSHWHEFIDGSFIKGENILNSELGRYYTGANVVFNDHWQSMASNGFISNRLFDCVACATFVVSDHVEGIDSIFGGSVYQYRDISEISGILQQKDIWPSSTELRMASNMILESHTFNNRAREILLAISHDCHKKLSFS